MKKGRRCPYCHLSLFYNHITKKWECPECDDVTEESNTLLAGEYR